MAENFLRLRKFSRLRRGTVPLPWFGWLTTSRACRGTERGLSPFGSVAFVG